MKHYQQAVFKAHELALCSTKPFTIELCERSEEADERGDYTMTQRCQLHMPAIGYLPDMTQLGDLLDHWRLLVPHHHLLSDVAEALELKEGVPPEGLWPLKSVELTPTVWHAAS